MNIRKYRPDDSEEKVDLHLKTIREVNSEDYSQEQIEAWTSFDEGQHVPEEKIERWVAEEDGKLVGFSDYRFDEGTITGVYVHPDYLRNGIGSKLLEKILEDARNRGLEELTAEASVTAKEFYQSHGFEVVKRTVHETSGEELEAFLMEKNLD